ncbi:MAG: hypothetical protein M3342_14470 [Bacteroidota bacterium]|nr:hypothetical protein [Flavisolibacter sp.]MDQ3845197.1 hypothetical protein [Bacteroidota bacterium]
MGLFNSYRQHLYRFFTKEEKEESNRMHPRFNKRLLQIMRFFGGKSSAEKDIEFFFYTDEEDKANNLAIELKN